MKKGLIAILAVLLAVAIAMPAFAAVEFKYGGQFRARIMSQDNLLDGNDNDAVFDDNQNLIDQRLRLYFTFQASQNLKLVTKFEMGDTVWGDEGTGGRVGADERIIELKNAYIEFNIPECPTTAIVGIQGINLLNSWIIDEDLSAAVLKTKLDPFTITVAYAAGQNENDETFTVGSSFALYGDDSDRVDSYILSVDYASGPFSASLIGYYQDASATVASMVPLLTTFNPGPAGGYPSGSLGGFEVEDNNLFDLGLNLGYKVDWLSAYISFVKNFGSVDFADESVDYDGWMLDAGATYFCGPYTLNIGGFYTSGRDTNIIDEEAGTFERDEDLSWFTYPLSTTKYFSEIIGGGILDRIGGSNLVATLSSVPGFNGVMWTGYPQPSNIWTVTIGGSWQILEKTKLSGSYWYFGASEDVLSGGFDEHGDFTELEMADDIGHELDLYLTQGIVDGLTLDLVAAYMFTGDAYSVFDEDDDVYELGARLQWNF